MTRADRTLPIGCLPRDLAASVLFELPPRDYPVNIDCNACSSGKSPSSRE